nr:AMP-binding protein [Mammaliicoccus sp. Marseille-Q6498]
MTILKRIEEQVHNKQSFKAMYVDDFAISYMDLWNESKKLSHELRQFSEGTKIGIAQEHPIIFMKWYLAVLMNKQIPCVIDATSSDERIDELLLTYKIQVLIDNQSNIKSIDIEDQFFMPKDILHIGFTSGTTGLPKAYMRNHSSWVKSFEYNELLLNHKSDVLVAPGPHAHSLSLYVLIYALCTGRCFMGQSKFDALLLNQTMKNMPSTQTLFIVPTMLFSLMNNKCELKYVERIFSSGAKLSRNVFQKFKQQYEHVNLIEFFGSSEASFISYNMNGNASIDSVGKLFPNVKIKLKDKSKDGIGRLYVKSEMTFSGYIGDVSEVEWINIGDWASINEQGELCLYGRESDRLIIGGKNVYPELIEQKVLSMNEVDEAIIVSEAHNKFGEVGVLIYKGANRLSYLNVKNKLLNDGVSRYEIPSKIIQVRKMIYTTSGKIARQKMKQAYEEGGEIWNQLL